MLKLIKYEFRKQLFSKIIILAVFTVFELFFLYNAYFQDGEGRIILSTMLLVMLVIASLSFVAFESIATYSRDLKTKQSYMLFLVPKSTYSIMGAKIITALFQLALVSAAFLILAAIDYTIIMVRFFGIKSFVDLINGFFTEFMDLDLEADIFILGFIVVMLDWFLIILTAMLSITLSSTFLSNSKLKGIISLSLFVSITYLSNKLLGIIIPPFDEITISYLAAAASATLVLSFAAYFATAWMLDKKVSV